MCFEIRWPGCTCLPAYYFCGLGFQYWIKYFVGSVKQLNDENTKYLLFSGYRCKIIIDFCQISLPKSDSCQSYLFLSFILPKAHHNLSSLTLLRHDYNSGSLFFINQYTASHQQRGLYRTGSEGTKLGG